MIHACAYTVLDSLVVEVTCLHGEDPALSHLVGRVHRTLADTTSAQQLRALAEALEVMALTDGAERERLGLWSLCDGA
jgi:hypothetical protein